MGTHLSFSVEGLTSKFQFEFSFLPQFQFEVQSMKVALLSLVVVFCVLSTEAFTITIPSDQSGGTLKEHGDDHYMNTNGMKNIDETVISYHPHFSDSYIKKVQSDRQINVE